MNLKFKRENYAHGVRASQAILQFGTGAMIDFDDQTLMIAAPELWENRQPIHDERLEKCIEEGKTISFQGFKPSSGQEKPGRLAYVRFPEWYYCPKCHLFQPVSKWEKQYRNTPGGSKSNGKAWSPYCFSCRLSLIPAPLVTVCQNGHIDDFPWDAWVHQKKPCSGEPVLEMRAGVGFEGTTIKCKKCGMLSSLAGSMNPEIFNELAEKTGNDAFQCSGRHPWRNMKEACGCTPRAVLRTSSSVHFPTIVSSLVIPPFSSLLTQQIEESTGYATLRMMLAGYSIAETPLPEEIRKGLVAQAIQINAKTISNEIGIDEEKILQVLNRKFTDKEASEPESSQSVFYRYQEYRALNGMDEAPDDERSDFFREGTNIEDYDLPFVYRISLLHKLREVRVLKGFTRLSPANELENDGAAVVSVKPLDEDWYPAAEVRGEGIFIEFDEQAIQEWEAAHPDVTQRAASLDRKYSESFWGKHHTRRITAKFLLLHTISHLLIKELSYACGYSVASLQERIYCSSPEDGVTMQGILIYTASGDLEGTLGGLVRQGRPDAFPAIFRHAMQASLVCSNDPVCSLSSGQGRDSLNLSACHACTLLPETSCEINNIFLDRCMISGKFQDRSIGLYSDVLAGRIPWKSTCQTSVQDAPAEEDAPSYAELIAVTGNPVSLSYQEIWNDLLDACDDEEEAKFLNVLLQADLESCEKPIENAAVIVGGQHYCCPYVWKEAKIIFCDLDDVLYDALKNCDWQIYLGNESASAAEQFIHQLKYNEKK